MNFNEQTDIDKDIDIDEETDIEHIRVWTKSLALIEVFGSL